MGSIATTVDEQLKILTDRGMTFDYEEAKLKEILLDIGYYKLGFYWHHFQKDRNHNFLEGTKISDVIKLYYLDVNSKSVYANDKLGTFVLQIYNIFGTYKNLS